MNKVYEDNLSLLINGDCITEMQNLIDNGVKVDKVITSPPYNIVRPNCSDRGYDIYQDGMTNEEYIEWTIKIFNLYDKILNDNGCIIYNMSYGTENTEVMNLTVAEILKRTNFTLADIIVWKKFSAVPNNVSSNKMTRICEFIYVFCRRNEFGTFTANKKIIGQRNETNQNIYENTFNFIQAPNNSETQNLNKATYSIELVKALIERYVRKTDVVLDNFSGTGTTMAACVSMGIKSIGIELSQAQCEHTIKRIDKGIQTDIFSMCQDYQQEEFKT